MHDNSDTLVETVIGMLSSGNSRAAIEILEQAVRLQPGSSAACRALAEAQLACGNLIDAERWCRQAIANAPKFDRAHYLLGVICAHGGKIDDSMTSLRRAIELRPDYFDAIRALAAVSGRSGDLTCALDCFRRLIGAGINNNEILLEYAETAERYGAVDEAISARQVLLEREPNNLENRFNLASLTGTNPPAIAPATLVTKTFDDYAERFESHLGHLRYSGPELLWNAVTARETRTELRVLDLGCGTGLCGRQFRKIADRLVGVDLSPQMLERAQKKGGYDELHCVDVIRFLDNSDPFDLIIAGDLLIYIGDLRPVFAATRSRISSGGRFAFTIERGDDHEISVSRSHRYVHSETYVRSVLAETGWRLAEIDPCVLRQENGVDVRGFVAVAEPV